MPAREGLQLTEPVPIDDDFCTGLAVIEDVGLGVRLVMFTEQTCYEAEATVRVVKRKIVMPLDAIGPAVDLLLRYLAHRGRKVIGEKLLRIVR